MEYSNCDMDATVQGPPERAVSLNQSATEIMVRLGLADRMVGTAYETDPVPDDIVDEYESIPLLTDGLLEHETLLQAQPDFVYSSFASFLTAENAGEREELHELGVPTYLTEFDCTYHAAVDGGATFEMLYDEIAQIAEIFDVTAAGEELVAEQQATVADGLATGESIAGSPELSLVLLDGGIVIDAVGRGPRRTAADVTEMLGATNAFSDASTKWPEVSWDQVASCGRMIVLADLTRGYPGDTRRRRSSSSPATRSPRRWKQCVRSSSSWFLVNTWIPRSTACRRFRPSPTAWWNWGSPDERRSGEHRRRGSSRKTSRGSSRAGTISRRRTSRIARNGSRSCSTCSRTRWRALRASTATAPVSSWSISPAGPVVFHVECSIDFPVSI